MIMFKKRHQNASVSLLLLLLLWIGLPMGKGSSLVYEDFKTARQKGRESVLPDFSFAGYRFGEHKIPLVKHKVFNVLDFGAIADDEGSDEAAIKATIAAAERNGSGIVYFPAGHYLVNTTPKEQNDYILIQKSHIILRGDGPEKTTVELKERAGDKTIWQGCYKFRFQRVTDHANPYSNSRITLKTRSLTRVSADVRRETFTVQVDNSKALAVGQWVTLYLPPTDDVDVKQFYTSPYEIPKQEQGARWYQGKMTLSERHLIAKIEGNLVTFHAPVHIPVKAEHGWEIHNFPHLEQVGVEGIHFKGNWTGVYPGNYRLKMAKRAYSPLMMSACVNSWIRDCRFSNYNQGMRLYYLARCSLHNIIMTGTGSNRGRHNLFLQKCTGVFVCGLHDTQPNQDGCTVTHSAIGNVFWRCSNHPTTPMDLHAAYPYANLYDNVQSSLKRHAGSGAGSYGGYCPQHLGKLVLWNHTYSGSDSALYPFWDKNDLYGAKHQFYVMPIVVGFSGRPLTLNPGQCEVLESFGQTVQPQSLYEAQVRHRLGTLPPWLDELSGKTKAVVESDPSPDPDAGITLHADFDHGSIGDLKEVAPNTLKGSTKHWKKADAVGDQYYWFYYRMNNVAGKTITTELTGLEGIYRGNPHRIFTDYTYPVVSYNQGHWQRITDVKYDPVKHSFTFTHTFEKYWAWVAYAHPYSLSYKHNFIAEIHHRDFVSVENLGSSVQGRPIEMLTITDRTVADTEKRVILITALQHPGEDCGAYLVEGLAHFLISDDPVAQNSRRRFIYKIIPMINPDGVYLGISRYNANMEDLNSEWDDDSTDLDHAPVEPEVLAIKQWTRQWLAQNNRLDLCLDFHSHSQQVEFNSLHSPAPGVLVDFVEILNRYWPLRWRLTKNSSGRMRGYYYTEKGIDAATIELTQSRATAKGPHLTINDYANYGKGLAKAIFDYFENHKK